ncbi:protein-L-isoaspartate O-methyltransferase family protein [Wenjunlia vitaminophila]|uniref:protein-L-isoaspartate O-methyltransferase family protein n=1 Tax=Wenjunlia vitaminophila TaxID=76728 RepID=UPI0003645E65|nr:methyltransferase domain-containing protein [Wenjunlia vitaminophila]
MTDFTYRQRRLDEAMATAGAWPTSAPWVRPAMAALPRHQWAPDRLWQWNGHAYAPVDSTTEPGRWADLVYAGPYDAAVTQVADGRPASSLSCPSVVADMLAAADLHPGQRVLELGAGTGWNAALIAHRVGAGRVVTVEVDQDLAAAAQARLDAAGARVGVRCGDGADGWADGGPYDRVIATYAVDTVPWPWVAQCRPSGRLVVPWGRLGHVVLTVAPDGRLATGRVAGLAQFMAAREVPPARSYADVRGDTPAEDEQPFRDLTELHTDWHLRFAVRVALPDVHLRTAVDDDGANAWLHDDTGSWAAVNAVGDGTTVAYQGGPRRLAAELATAWDEWAALDRPSLYDWGLTVTAASQTVWCRTPDTAPAWAQQREPAAR